MTKEFLISVFGLAFFIVCPRMAAMIYLISKYSQTSLVLISVLGSVLAIPLIVVMVLIFSKFGVLGALLFCIITDLAAASVMRELNIKAAIETIVIAVFVILGVKIAPYITTLLIK